MNTVEDIYALPDGERAELIDGVLYSMAPPGRTHQKISMELSFAIREYIRKNNGTCEIYAAPFAVFLTQDSQTYVEPDISVICDTSKLDEKGCHGAPDWIMEILSPSSHYRDTFKKLLKYATAGVREYWIINPIHHTVSVYNFERDRSADYTFSEEIPSGIFSNFRVTLQDLLK